MGSFFLNLDCLECHAQDCIRMHHLKGKFKKFSGGGPQTPPVAEGYPLPAKSLRALGRRSRGKSALHFNPGLPDYKFLDQPLNT